MKGSIKILLLVLLGLFVWVPFCGAAGTVTATCSNIMGGEIRTITYAWVDDTAGSSLASDSITCPGETTGTTFVQGYFLCGSDMTTTVAHRPTDNYDVYIYDSNSFDLMGGAMTNRDSNGTETSGTGYRMPVVMSGSTTGMGCRYMTGAFTFTLSGNSVASAAGTCTLYFSKP